VVNATLGPLLTPRKDPVPTVQEAGWAPGPVWTGAENLAPTGIRQCCCTNSDLRGCYVACRVIVSTFRMTVSKDRSASIYSIRLSIQDTSWRIRGDTVKYQHREVDNRTRRFISTVVEADPVSKNYFTSPHGVTSPATPESPVSWLADGMLGTQGLQSMCMAIRHRPEQAISTRLCQMWTCITSPPSCWAGLANFIPHESHKDSPEGRTCVYIHSNSFRLWI